MTEKPVKPPVHSEGAHVLQERQRMRDKVSTLEALIERLTNLLGHEKMRSASRGSKVPRG